ncbi:MAG: hypothetical protein WCJ03_12095 [Bacteroidales bacterium]
MKTYYYKIESEKKRQNGGRNVTASVFTVAAGKIKKLGEVKWITSAFKGEKSTVYEFLYDNKLVAKKEYDLGKGYYRPSASKIKIEEL